ncbi:DUF2231 domain-containing protein [Rhizobium sp. BK377]|jgi:uncharacterized membrane protein|uniref:DUF2231 domain-containing protein n=1 Tax=Rhizobium sp. BK377 TaxID=2587058 RepID=UPI0018374711|nr:DUF2231 domain-containing protein [Rhizobium sp. BK377]MBB3464897.1 putative membrane protein [Rhizobium sp. BK377]
MTYTTMRSYIAIVAPPLRSVPLHFSAACLVGALLTDIVYWRTAEMMWTNFSSWLLTFGLLLGALAAIAVLIDIFSGRLLLRGGLGWLYIIGNIAAFVVSLFNAFIHSRDAWTSVVPTGLTLSVVAAVLIVINACIGWVILRQRAGGLEE